MRRLFINLLIIGGVQEPDWTFPIYIRLHGYSQSHIHTQRVISNVQEHMEGGVEILDSPTDWDLNLVLNTGFPIEFSDISS